MEASKGITTNIPECSPLKQEYVWIPTLLSCFPLLAFLTLLSKPLLLKTSHLLSLFFLFSVFFLFTNPFFFKTTPSFSHTSVFFLFFHFLVLSVFLKTSQTSLSSFFFFLLSFLSLQVPNPQRPLEFSPTLSVLILPNLSTQISQKLPLFSLPNVSSFLPSFKLPSSASVPPHFLSSSALEFPTFSLETPTHLVPIFPRWAATPYNFIIHCPPRIHMDSRWVAINSKKWPKSDIKPSS